MAANGEVLPPDYPIPKGAGNANAASNSGSWWSWAKAKVGWGDAAKASGTAAEAGEVAAGEAAEQVAGRTVFGTVLRVVGVGVGGTVLGGIGGAIPGALEFHDGIKEHDNLKKVRGGVAAVGGGSMAAAGAATGGEIGLLFGPADWITVPAGIIIGGTIGGIAGTAVGHKAVDSVVGMSNSVSNYVHKLMGSAEETKDQAMAGWSPAYKTYQEKLKAAREAVGDSAKNAYDEAAVAGKNLMDQLNKLGVRGDLTKEEKEGIENSKKNATFDFNATVDAMNKQIAGVQNTVAGATTATVKVVKDALSGSATHTGGHHKGGHHTGGGAPHHDEKLRDKARGMQALIDDANHTLQMKNPDGSLKTEADGSPAYDGLVGAKTIRQLEAAHIIREGEIQIQPGGVATDAQLTKLFTEHTKDLQAYADRLSAAQQQVPVAQRTAPEQQAPAPIERRAPEAPSTPAQYQIASDTRLQAALASLTVHDVEEMHPGCGPLHIGSLVDARKMREIGITVDNDNGTELHREYNDKKLPLVTSVPDLAGSTRAVLTRLGSIDILPEGSSQTYMLRDAKGNEVDGAAPISPQAIAQARSEHIGHIDIEQANGTNTFVFNPVKTPPRDPQPEVQQDAPTR